MRFSLLQVGQVLVQEGHPCMRLRQRAQFSQHPCWALVLELMQLQRQPRHSFWRPLSKDHLPHLADPFRRMGEVQDTHCIRPM
jgi:hypothetical protein